MKGSLFWLNEACSRDPVGSSTRLSLKEILNRSEAKVPDVSDAVADIISRVRKDGDSALKEYAAKFDGADLEELTVSEEELRCAMEETDGYFIETLKEARENIRQYHEKQVRGGYEIKREDGVVLGQKVTPLARVGV